MRLRLTYQESQSHREMRLMWVHELVSTRRQKSLASERPPTEHVRPVSNPTVLKCIETFRKLICDNRTPPQSQEERDRWAPFSALLLLLQWVYLKIFLIPPLTHQKQMLKSGNPVELLIFY